MTCEDIISRAAYNIGDEFYKEISKDEWLRMLRRVYRDFCEGTKILRNAVSFTTTTNKSYKLYGLDSNGVYFGDNFIGFFRAEYNGSKAYEVDLDSLKETVYADDTPSAEEPIVYTIMYVQQYLWICFKHTPKVGDIVKLWYYELPKITDPILLTDSPLVDLKYHDKLVQGLEVQGWRRKFILSISKKEPSPMVKVYKEEYEEVKMEWLATIQKVEQEVMSFKDDTIPLQQWIATPMESWQDDDNTEIDELAI